MNIDKLLKKAHKLFLIGDYEEALVLYSQVLSYEPNNLEYQIYPLICDIAIEDFERGEALFDFFSIEKDYNLEYAAKYVQDAIRAYDGDNEMMMKLIKDISKHTVETLEAIDYNDFLKIANEKGSFRIAFEDLMFSTKIAINSKEELVDFIDKLIDNNFTNAAYSYLDGFNKVLRYDKDIGKLYQKLKSNDNENNKSKT